MNFRLCRRLMLFSVFLLTMSIFISCGGGSGGGKDDPAPTGYVGVRLFHLSPTDKSYTVRFDVDNKEFEIAYSGVLPYISIPDESFTISYVTKNGETETLDYEKKGKYSFDRSYSVFLFDDSFESENPVIEAEDGMEPLAGYAWIRFIHGIPDADPSKKANIVNGLDNTVLFEGVSYKNEDQFEYRKLPAKEYSFILEYEGEGTPLISTGKILLGDSQIYTMVSYGTLDVSDSYDPVIKVYKDDGTGTGEASAILQVMNVSPSAGDIHIIIDGEEIARDLMFNSATRNFNLLDGEHRIVVMKTNSEKTETEIASLSSDFEGGCHYTLYVIDDISGGGNAAELRLIPDDMKIPEPGISRVRFIHAVPDIASVNIGESSGTESLVEDLAYGEPSNGGDFIDLPAGAHPFGVTDKEGGQLMPVETLELNEFEIATVFISGYASPKDPSTDPAIDFNILRLAPKVFD